MNADGPLSYRVEAPMRWVAVDGAFDAAAIDYWSEANLRVLTQIAQFEERGVPVEAKARACICRRCAEASAAASSSTA